MPTLTPQQQQFAEEYLRDRNATAAYKRAGYRATGHSAESAASRLLKNREVMKIIALRQADVTKQVQVNPDSTLQALIREAKGEGPTTSADRRILACAKLARDDGNEKTDATGVVDQRSPI